MADLKATALSVEQPRAGSDRIPKGTSRRLTSRLSADRWALAGIIFLAVLSVVAICAPLIAPSSPTASDTSLRFRPPLSVGKTGTFYLLGTDNLGRDILSRIIYGARVSLVIGFATVIISAILGLVLGVTAGYVGGWVGDLIMRFADVQLAFPFILLAISIVAVIGPGLQNIVLVLGVAGWLIPARIVRAEVLSLREREFILAARAMGAPGLYIVIRHIVPSVLPSTVVVASFTMVQMIISESALSFVGLGIPPPTPSWGGMLADGQNYLAAAWWVSTMPGLALMLTVLSIYLIGDFLRDLLDPRLQTHSVSRGI